VRILKKPNAQIAHLFLPTHKAKTQKNQKSYFFANAEFKINSKLKAKFAAMKLLLIEDEIELAKSIQQFLNQNDFVCERVDNLSSAKDKIADYNYDCILLDLMLPDGNGFELLKEIKKINKTEGVIIISARELLETRIEGLTLGADDYLVKPFHLRNCWFGFKPLSDEKS
jgi:PleD family two-component response regulator